LVIANLTDKSTRILTKEECEAGLAKSRKDLLIYQKENAPKEKIYFSEAEIAIWERLLFHIKNGETITINDKQEIHWLETNKKQVN
jgi:hypothetical protein